MTRAKITRKPGSGAVVEPMWTGCGSTTAETGVDCGFAAAGVCSPTGTAMNVVKMRGVLTAVASHHASPVP